MSEVLKRFEYLIQDREKKILRVEIFLGECEIVEESVEDDFIESDLEIRFINVTQTIDCSSVYVIPVSAIQDL
jgi:hypothetical protein